MEQIVEISPKGQTSAQLGEYTVGIFLLDTPNIVRVDHHPVILRPGLTLDWERLSGYPIEIRRVSTDVTIQFRLITAEGV